MSSPLEITLATQIGIAATQTTLTLEELIVSMRAANASDDIIRQTLLNDLENSGRIFGAFKNKIKSTVRNAIESSANTQSTKEFEQAGVQRYRWQTVGKNICQIVKNVMGLLVQMNILIYWVNLNLGLVYAVLTVIAKYYRLVTRVRV